jgi:hypothetical protein
MAMAGQFSELEAAIEIALPRLKGRGGIDR